MLKFSIFLIFLFMISCESDSNLSAKEEADIESYISKNKLVITEKTSSGLRFIRTFANANGAVLKTGQYVTVKYAGRLLSDKQFDAGTFPFSLGVGQVVAGFDEGIAKLKVGEKGTLIFPSSLGYGSQGAGGDIKGNTPLIFEIEVLSAR